MGEYHKGETRTGERMKTEDGEEKKENGKIGESGRDEKGKKKRRKAWRAQRVDRVRSDSLQGFLPSWDAGGR